MSIRLGQNEVQGFLNVTTYDSSNINPDNFYTKEEINNLIPSLTGYATEEFVTAKLADLVGEVPETLDTLEELADALSENEGLIAGLNEAIGKKANKSEVYTKSETENEITSKLKDYALKSEIPSVPSFEDYATKEYVNEKIDEKITELGEGTIDLSEYAKKSEVPTKTSQLTNDSGFLTQHQSLTEYATKEWVEDKHYLTEHQSLSGYATEVYVDTKVSNLVGGAPETLDTLKELADALASNESITNLLIQAISNKAEKSELFSKDYNDLINKPTIPSLTGYATETYVKNYVSQELGAIDSILDEIIGG